VRRDNRDGQRDINTEASGAGETIGTFFVVLAMVSSPAWGPLLYMQVVHWLTKGGQ